MAFADAIKLNDGNKTSLFLSILDNNKEVCSAAVPLEVQTAYFDPV